MLGAIEIDLARKIDIHLKAADYYVAVGWAQMVEGRSATAALKQAEVALKKAEAVLVDEVKPVGHVI